ncbi:BNR repeat domain protein [Enhygromyxa salina]|uniref:BNR repeat domain protein n=1 Tax=Enhygromyxa salina TaxID=215803 RepID=A0A0C2DGZ1_9BACT|nr:DUF4886 domain-containing protein [Enhygromyxa salina]KIG18942.1 BNR repeat domain protein [Enhygromyxa salina]
MRLFCTLTLVGLLALPGCVVVDGSGAQTSGETGSGDGDGDGDGEPGDGDPGDGDPGDGDGDSGDGDGDPGDGDGDGDPGDGDGDPGDGDGDSGDGDGDGDGDPQPVHVLFVGNSYTAANDLPGIVEALSASSLAPVISDSITVGGARVIDHLQNPAVLDALAGDWDVVVLQGQSVEPILDYPSFEQAVIEFTQQVAMAGDARVLLFQTWPREEGNADLMQLGMDLTQMHQALAEGYVNAALASDTEVAPVGDAWWMAWWVDPPIQLYVGDGSHPSLAGSYLAGCVMFGKISNLPCTSTDYAPEQLPPDEVEWLQLLADISTGFEDPSP